jgi:hypothetical protein
MRGINEDISKFVIWMLSLSLCCTEMEWSHQVYRLTTNRGSETEPRLKFSCVFFSTSGWISVQYLENGYSYFLHKWFSIFVRPWPGNAFFYKTRASYNWCQGPAVEKHCPTPPSPVECIHMTPLHSMPNNLWNWYIVTHLAYNQLAKEHYRKWVNLVTSQP